MSKNIRRREFVALFGGAVAAWSIAARAQQAAIPVIGFLHPASAAPFAHLIAGFRSGLKEAGYVEGQNLAVEYRWADGHADRLPELVADLVRRRVAVIVAGGGEPSALAAKAATTTIPIVFTVGGDPVKAGIVPSLSRPSGNVTGINILTEELEAKRFGLLHEIVPKSSIIAYLVNPNYPPAEANIDKVETAARAVGRQILLAKAGNESDIDAAFATISQSRGGAVLVGADPYFNSRREQIVALAARQAIPAAYEQREFALAGGLLSYGTSITDAYRQLGVYAARILKGEKPSDLPVMQLSKFELIINLKTAKVLGLTIPPGVLAIADEVIE